MKLNPWSMKTHHCGKMNHDINALGYTFYRIWIYKIRTTYFHSFSCPQLPM